MKLSKISALVLAILMLVCSLAACSPNGQTNETESSTMKETLTESKKESATESGSQTESATQTETESQTEIAVTFDGSTYNSSLDGAITHEGKVFTITKAGVYRLSGKIDDGQIAVNVSKFEQVELKFDGLTVSNSTSAPIYVMSADKVEIKLVKDTVNTLTDAYSYNFPLNEDKPNACIYSSDDLTINGNGTLIVNARFNNGIGTKNDLKIKEGNIVINAAKNAFKGNGSITVEGGDLKVESCKRAFKSDSLETDKGFVTILGGTIDVTATNTVIEATNSISVSGCTIKYSCGSDVTFCDGNVSISDGCMTQK